jgi:predicted aspartyl protease
MQLKYFIVGILGLLLLQSCRRLSYLEDCQNILLEKNCAIIHMQIEGKDQPMLLDLGASSSVLYDTAVIPDFYKKSKGRFGIGESADRKQLNCVTIPLKVSNKLYSADNRAFNVLTKPPQKEESNCRKEPYHIGLYGYDLMKKHKTGYLLDFETGQICNLKPVELATAIANGYQAVKAKIIYSHIIIYVMIDGIEYAFKFDTGFTGSFTIPYDNDKINFLNDAHRSLEGMMGRSVSGIVTGKESSYNKKITFGGLKYTTEIIISEPIKSKLMGMGFIKAFNWIIDNKNKKVYIKKNNISPDEPSKTTNDYYAVEIAGKLLVAARSIGSNDFEIGDEIIKVNDEEVTSSNRCTLLKLLKETENWKALKVKTRKQ